MRTELDARAFGDTQGWLIHKQIVVKEMGLMAIIQEKEERDSEG